MKYADLLAKVSKTVDYAVQSDKEVALVEVTVRATLAELGLFEENGIVAEPSGGLAPAIEWQPPGGLVRPPLLTAVRRNRAKRRR